MKLLLFWSLGQFISEIFTHHKASSSWIILLKPVPLVKQWKPCRLRMKSLNWWVTSLFAPELSARTTIELERKHPGTGFSPSLPFALWHEFAEGIKLIKRMKKNFVMRLKEKNCGNKVELSTFREYNLTPNSCGSRLSLKRNVWVDVNSKKWQKCETNYHHIVLIFYLCCQHCAHRQLYMLWISIMWIRYYVDLNF